MVEYTYNAWGKLMSTTGPKASNLGVKNHLRYHGYYYDVETNLYYLQSRYYDPQIGRFINADDTDYIGADGSFASYNLFAYCNNNPVINSDPSGYFSIPRSIISCAIDAIIWTVFSPGAATFATITQPVKALARRQGKELIKQYFRGAMNSIVNTLGKAITKVAKYLVPIVKKAVGWLFKKWASKLTVNKLASTIAGGLISITKNSILNAIASNVTVFLSIGGFIAGMWDIFSDNKLNGWIKIC